MASAKDLIVKPISAKDAAALVRRVHYSGKVVATLEAPEQQRMRCRFHLVAPARGMSGGGEGQCQLSDGRALRASFAGK